jgi:5-methylcytosine-specific restriction endonuclease McrA
MPARQLIDEIVGTSIPTGYNPQATATNTPRDNRFTRAAKTWLADQTCAACGRSDHLEAHHVLPFHLYPQFEMDPRNWIALGRHPDHLNCHLIVGHLGDYEAFNPLVRELAATLQFSRRLSQAILAAIRTG